jgi:hypothetical protein
MYFRSFCGVEVTLTSRFEGFSASNYRELKRELDKTETNLGNFRFSVKTGPCAEFDPIPCLYPDLP